MAVSCHYVGLDIRYYVLTRFGLKTLIFCDFDLPFCRLGYKIMLNKSYIQLILSRFAELVEQKYA